ncbi:polysaccharide deacetylase family protein [Verrucomicrobium sp. BvORR106]|uniref:polysaccharide deacetylase family protein n=1 Tax=Verrucomicrobium sp. BvORR106 TaxID=1403819 RepID=UPI0009DDA1B9|nr:polysaccharide deacetylase family protein [Verrucomicrobium sp. BvORR106]
MVEVVKNLRRQFRRGVILWNAVAPVVALVLLLRGQGWLALAILMSAHALWLVPTLWPACDWLGEVVCTLKEARDGQHERPYDEEAKEVWLTIDDGPDPVDTPLLLDLLDQFGARATFFFIGARARQHPELVGEVLRRGHTVGNHTLNHVQFWFWAFGPSSVSREVGACQDVLGELSGGEAPRWFRAPAGFKNPLVQAEVERQGLRLAGWSSRGRDGVIKDQEAILSRLIAGVKPGAILLMHEGRDDGQGGRLAPQVLEKLLTWLRQHGYRCVLP